MTQQTSEKLICLAAVAGAHGVRGGLKLRCFTEQPENVTRYGPVYNQHGQKLFALKSLGPCKGGLIVQAEGITNRDQAEALKGTQLFIRRSDLPSTDEDEFYFEDLIGLAVQASDRTVGRVRSVDDHGASPIIEIETETGEIVALPFTRDCVPKVDIARGLMVVNLPEVVSP